MDANLLEDSITAVLSEALTGVDETVFVVNPAPGTVDELVEVLSTDDDSPVRLLADEAALQQVLDDFHVASRAPHRVEAGPLGFRPYMT